MFSQRPQDQSAASSACVKIIDYVTLARTTANDHFLDQTPINWFSKSTGTALSSSQVSRLLKMFKKGREEVILALITHQHSAENVNRVRGLLNFERLWVLVRVQTYLTFKLSQYTPSWRTISTWERSASCLFQKGISD